MANVIFMGKKVRKDRKIRKKEEECRERDGGKVYENNSIIVYLRGEGRSDQNSPTPNYNIGVFLSCGST